MARRRAQSPAPERTGPPSAPRRIGDPSAADGAGRSSAPEAAGRTRFITPAVAPIIEATDLGSVGVLKHGNLYLLTDPLGDVAPDARGLGLYEGDTRRLSRATLRINGRRPLLLQASSGGSYEGTIQLTNPPLDRRPDEPDERGPEAPGLEDTGPVHRLGIERRRLVTGRAFEERLRITSYAEVAEDLSIEVELAADAADIFEVRGWLRPRRGRQLPVAIRGERVTFRYDGLDGRRVGTHVAFSLEPDESGAVDRPGPDGGGWVRLAWRWRIAPGATRELRWVVWASERRSPGTGGSPEPAGAADPATRPPTADERGIADSVDMLFPPVPPVTADEAAAACEEWSRGLTRIRTDDALANLVIDRAASDLRLLLDDGPGPGERYLAAGVPWFATLFGRDAIIAALQTLAVQPQLAIDTLEVLARLQATDDDPIRDAEPGKILHELRTGEMARTGEIPHRPYYGTVDATPLWLILLGATYDWTGDRSLVERLWPNALRALEWIDRWGDRNGDGLIDYQRRTPGGLVNQGWKDSSDGIRDRHGRLADTPIALAEVQGYVFDARRRMADLARLRGDTELADRLVAQAGALRQRFEAAFWSEAQGCYAIAVGGDGRPADAVGSNQGHCLWSGIVAPERAQRVVERLMATDMFTGWGIRTFAARQPGYNPISYHVGTVWPHDVSLIAAGFRRYGQHGAATRLASSMFEAARQFPELRLPELFCGYDRAVAPAPVPYPVACSPQAWAAGSIFLLIETMLGIHAHADRQELELSRPSLPDWLRRLTIRNLRVGGLSADLELLRDHDGTSVEVLARSRDLTVTVRS